HPRPDESHITRAYVFALAPVVTTEFNIEGYPSPEFMDLVLEVKPAQVTLVPDAPGQVTSNSGWDVVANEPFLREICRMLKNAGIRSSIFVAADPAQVLKAAEVGADRVELYTKPYADLYPTDPEAAIAPFVEAAKAARDAGIGLNAGHDLSLVNLAFYVSRIPWTDEVSIGHALISDCLYLGLPATIAGYLEALGN
ncbi:MAG: pyridoxine 5'-phosphate synthase, partial [Muribaculaceae bacterium]|nr:pyridoxine 5'-phosphate synthase [Muribaculaceae bacterium]